MDDLEYCKAKLEAIKMLCENDEMEAVKVIVLEDDKLEEVIEEEPELIEEEF